MALRGEGKTLGWRAPPTLQSGAPCGYVAYGLGSGWGAGPQTPLGNHGTITPSSAHTALTGWSRGPA